MTYQEILDKEISATSWAEQDKLLSSVVRRRFGVSKASGVRKAAVLSLIRAGHKQGRYTLGINRENGAFCWSIGSGEEGKVVLISGEEALELEDSRVLLLRAKVNILKLENMLQRVCSSLLRDKYGEDWEHAMNDPQISSLQQISSRIQKNPWSAGVTPHILDIATFDTFAAIINSYWLDVFAGYFAQKWLTVSKLQELSYYRNAIQHNNILSDKELMYFNFSVEIFIEKFGRVS